MTQIFDWRVACRLAVPTIAWRLNGDLAAYPPPGDGPGWTESSVAAILRNPKYTGYMVYGRTRKIPGTKKSRPAPPDQWIWSPEPTHDPLTSRATWDAAQKTGAERGNVRDAEKPTTQPGTWYSLRSRIRHQACQHRMYGIRRPSSSKTSPGAVYTYYHCPYNPSNPRHVAACPGHPATSVSIREETILAAIAGFLDQHVFSHDRAAMLAAQIPATSAEQAAARQRQETHLRAELARIATAQAGLFTELERLGADTTPATHAYRQRIQARHAELHDEHTRTQAQLVDDLAAAATPDQDPALLDELPYLAGQLTDAPAHLTEALINALDIPILYRPEQGQATIWATLTDTTPATITALLSDPRVAASQTSPQPSARPGIPVPNAELAQGPIAPETGHDHGSSRQALSLVSRAVPSGLPRPEQASQPGPAAYAPLFPLVMSRKPVTSAPGVTPAYSAGWTSPNRWPVASASRLTSAAHSGATALVPPTTWAWPPENRL